MATKNVLSEAIIKLTNANIKLKEKIHKINDKKKAEDFAKQITINESMILDYKFRLKYDE